MDLSRATKIVYSRIQKLEPDNVTTKIVWYMLLQDHCERDMIQFAFAPDDIIHSLIEKIKSELGLALRPTISPPISNPLPSSPATYCIPRLYLNPHPASHEPMHNPVIAYFDSIPKDYHSRFMSFDHQLEQVNPGISAFPIKACHYFNKGFCKHGSSCRYFHGQAFPESCPKIFCPNLNEVDQILFPGSLEKLELEITQLLRSRKGNPVSIASLPVLYYERFGKTLQAEGYLTESQRHGKAGYSLTKLLARLKNNICLIERPHGQHSVILMEDAPRYMEKEFKRSDPGPIIHGSRQIYLTFPAESNFTEEDVANYFNNFGPVEDVRIPCQEQRMFGFVTFVYADTVRIILSTGNPHYVCGARIRVKPYREKSNLVDRKYADKLEPSMYYHSHKEDMDSDLHTMPTGWMSSRLLRKQQLMEEHEQALEIERRRLSELKFPANDSFLSYSLDELEVSAAADHSKFLSTGSTNVGNTDGGKNCEGLDLPDR